MDELDEEDKKLYEKFSGMGVESVVRFMEVANHCNFEYAGNNATKIKDPDNPNGPRKAKPNDGNFRMVHELCKSNQDENSMKLNIIDIS